MNKPYQYEITHDFQAMDIHKPRGKTPIGSEYIRMTLLKEEMAFMLYDNIRDNSPQVNAGNSNSNGNGNAQNRTEGPQGTQAAKANSPNNGALLKFLTFYNSVKSSPLA
jgi:hypothetical protein